MVSFDKMKESYIMKLKTKMENISYGHLKSEKAVDRHFFLKGYLDDSLLQLLAILQEKEDFKGLNISRLINLFIMKGIHELGNMETGQAFETVKGLNAEFMEL